MTAIISSTYDSKYFWFLPVVMWAWNKLNVDVICFVPAMRFEGEGAKIDLINDTVMNHCGNNNMLVSFVAPKHKEATYAQCSRLYAAALDLPEDEILITSDVDMALFKLGHSSWEGIVGDGRFFILGADLIPEGQFPICYVSAKKKDWERVFCKGRSYQQCLDDLLGHIEAEHFRGNYWGKDQETMFGEIISSGVSINTVDRARPGTQFASRRYDRDDAYLLDRLDPNTIDYHMPRPGYDENNFNQILTVLKYHYPNDNFEWLVNYKKEYLKLI